MDEFAIQKGHRYATVEIEPTYDREVVDRVRVDEANRKLAAVYVLKEDVLKGDLKHLWSYRHIGYARQFWQGWYNRAVRSRIEPLKKFAMKLKAYLPGILSHCRFPLHTGVLEGINNKIKLIKRMAYGFRDDAYFFLKIRDAFPGDGRGTIFLGRSSVPGACSVVK